MRPRKLLTALCLTGFVTLIAGCAAPPPRTAASSPPPARPVVIPPELLEPVPVPAREVATLRDAALKFVDYDEALGRANGQIVTIGRIVAAHPTRAAP